MCIRDRYMDAGIPEGQYNYNPETGEVSRYYSLTWMEALVAFGIAVGGVIIFVVSLHSSYKLKKKQYFYPFQKLGRMTLEQKEDQFINETVKMCIRDRCGTLLRKNRRE